MDHGYMPHSLEGLKAAEKERGPRFFVSYARGDKQYGFAYFDTAEAADEGAARYRKDYRHVRITPPSDLMTLTEMTRQLGKERKTAIEAEREATGKVKAAVVRLVALGTSETQAAEIADVDRMTVRKWIGK